MNDIESRLAAALRARANDVEPEDEHAALDHITQRVNVNRRRGFVVLSAAAAIVVLVGAIALLNRDDGKNPQHITTATNAGDTTTTNNTTPPSVIPQGATGIWPFASMNRTFSTPEEAAKSFAVEYLGMTNARVGKVEAGFEYETNVEIFPNDRGSARTVVRVTNHQQNGYVVLGAMADQIQVDQPRVQDNTLTSPLPISGTSVAFEATLGIQLRPLGSTTPVLEDHTNGGSTDMQPFSTTITPPAIDQPLVLIVFEGDASGAGDMTKATVIALAPAGAAQPSDFVGIAATADLEHVDFAGNDQRTLASQVAIAVYAPAAKLVAYAPLGEACRTDFATLDNRSTPSSFAGVPVAISADGSRLTYLKCDTQPATYVERDLTTNTDVAEVLSPTPLPALPSAPVVATVRGRFGTTAFFDGTNISSFNPSDGKVVNLVTPAAAPISLDADESGRYLIWVDVNHDLWTWSGGDPVKVGSGFISAAW